MKPCIIIAQTVLHCLLHHSMSSTACWISNTINPMRMFARLQCYMPKCCNTRAMPPVATILHVHAGRMLRLPCSTAATVAGQRLHGRGTATAPAAVRRGRLSCCSACHPTTAGQLRMSLTLRARGKHQQVAAAYCCCIHHAHRTSGLVSWHAYELWHCPLGSLSRRPCCDLTSVRCFCALQVAHSKAVRRPRGAKHGELLHRVNQRGIKAILPTCKQACVQLDCRRVSGYPSPAADRAELLPVRTVCPRPRSRMLVEASFQLHCLMAQYFYPTVQRIERVQNITLLGAYNRFCTAQGVIASRGAADPVACMPDVST